MNDKGDEVDNDDFGVDVVFLAGDAAAVDVATVAVAVLLDEALFEELDKEVDEVVDFFAAMASFRFSSIASFLYSIYSV